MVNSINEWATNQGLVASIAGEDFIRIIDFTGETWATMYTSVCQPETWMCYTECPNMLAGLLGRSAPVFGSSEIEWPKWPSNEQKDAYFEVDIGYKIIEEMVTLTNGKRLKGWVVSPPQIKAKRGAKYDLIRQANAHDGTFYFWQPGKLAIKALEPKEVKKMEIISNEN